MIRLTPSDEILPPLSPHSWRRYGLAGRSGMTLPPDLIYISPPYNAKAKPCSALAGLISSLPWLREMAPLLEATWDTHVFISDGNLVFMLPYGLLKTLCGRSPDPSEPYPEAFVFGSGDAYAGIVHETAAGAMLFDPAQAFAAMSVSDRSQFILDPFCGNKSYRCLSAMAAEKLGRCVLNAAAKAKGLPARWIAPREPITDGTADGGQDGLLEIGNHHFWAQVTGGRTPDILPSAKGPNKIAEHFFIPEGSSQMKGGKLAKRQKLFRDRMPAQADVLHLAVGKAAPLGLPRAIRGVVWGKAAENGIERRFVQTITIHPLMIPLRR